MAEHIVADRDRPQELHCLDADRRHAAAAVAHRKRSAGKVHLR